MNLNRSRALAQLSMFVSILILWQVFGSLNKSVFFAIGSPQRIYQEFAKLWIEDKLYIHFFITGGEAVTGLVIGTLIGSVSGLLLWYSDKFTSIIRPFIIAIGTLPILAFAPLFIFWFGIGFGMKVAIAAFSTVFVAFNQAQRGAISVSTEYIETVKGMNASKTQIFSKIIVPASINWVFSSMRLNVGFGLLGAFIGEFVSSDKGLGHLILKAAGLYNTSRALAAAVGIAVLAIILDYLARLIEKNSVKILQWLSVPQSLRKK